MRVTTVYSSGYFSLHVLDGVAFFRMENWIAALLMVRSRQSLELLAR